MAAIFGAGGRDARKLAASAGAPEDADFLEWNARSQVTSWFPVQGKATAGCEGTATKLDGLWEYAKSEPRIAGFMPW